MPEINREGRKKRELRNLLRRGRKWYWKKMINGKVQPLSLGTDDLELAKARRDKLEQESTEKDLQDLRGPRSRSGTLADIFPKYEALGGLVHKTIRANVSSMMTVWKVALGKEQLEAADVRLDAFSPRIIRDYQDNLRRRYELAAGTDEKERRMARDKADRTSKSTIGQAQSIFCKRRQLIERYREGGVDIPKGVLEFRDAGAVGKMTSKVYFPPSDLQLKETFERIEELKASECAELTECYYLFWAALATGCRRTELAHMKVSDLVDLDGRLWVGAGLGKDGRIIQIPVIDWQVHPASTISPATVLRELRDLRLAEAGSDAYLFNGGKYERYDDMPDRLNDWMSRLGWKDEKKLHGLRAYIAGKIYTKNPRLAQLYLRHKSIKTTEDFYSHFLTLQGAFDFSLVPAAAPVVVVQTSGQVAA